MTDEPKHKIDSNELGFGTKYSDRSYRMINKDGSFNIRREGVAWNIFHYMINLKWYSFLLIILAAYLIINSVFAVIYIGLGVEHISGIVHTNMFEDFLYAFYFSSQTMTTVGYGFFHPADTATNIVASLEALFGLLCFALATGLVYGKFSKPQSGTIFSENGLIAPYKDGTSLQVRVANKHDNLLVDVHAQMIMIWTELEKGIVKRRFTDLNLEMEHINFMAMNWTIVHPIDENSPLFEQDQDMLNRENAEFIILIKAFDETFSQTIHGRTSFKAGEVIFNAKFDIPYDF
ncbi:MAG: hypothetical protein GY751_17940 [Bacteroidetes bacterium]|nr:hypothetical protein [Bacteroidota bacterium]